MITIKDLQKFESIDEVLDNLLSHAPEKILNQATHDALLDDLFSTIEDFHTTVFIPDDKLDAFKARFNDADISKMRNVDRVIDTLVDKMKKEEKIDLAKRVLKSKWFEENSKGDLAGFIGNLKPSFWGLS